MKKDPRRRVFKSSKDAVAGIELTDTSAKLIGDSNNFVAVNHEGIYLKGNISMITDGTGIRRGALFVQMPDMLRMIPSTIITPNPVQIPVPPVTGLINLAKDLAFFLSLLV